jgi:peptide/nickel transport system substrate-binding protein
VIFAGTKEEEKPAEVKEVPEGIKRGGTIILSMPGPVITLDPHKVVSHESFPATFHLFSALTRIGHDFSAEPELAKSWEHSEDAMTWTFHLYENATFHNGRPVTAEDVKFSLERTLDPNECPRGYSTIGPIEQISPKDEHTVIIKLSKPYLDLPVDLGGIYPRIVLKENLQEINQNPIGSGPFKFKNWEAGGKVGLVKNENYFLMGEDGKPIHYIDELVIVPIKDPNSELSALRSGETDVMFQLPYDLVEIAKGDPSIEIDETATGYHSLNLHLDPSFYENEFDRTVFRDKRVREAFAYLIDREAALALAIGGHGYIANDQPIPTYHVYANPNLAPREHNVELAKKLLKEAGIKPGTHFTLYTTGGRPGLKELTLAFKEMAKEADIIIDVEVMEATRYFADVEYKGPFYVDNWGARQTINGNLKQFYITGGSNNCTALSDPELDKILLEAESETVFEKRRDLYWKAMEIISDHAVTIIPYYKKFYTANVNDVVGALAHPMTYMWLDRAWKK